MDKFSPVPRPTPPQPKSFNIEPPTYTVPDVTLMFDSDDSLIWKPGENAKAFLQRMNSQDSKDGHKKTTTEKHYSVGLEKIGTISQELNKPQINNLSPSNPILQELQDSQNNKLNPSNPRECSPTVCAEPVSSILPIPKSSKPEYNPGVYASPKLVSKPSQHEGLNPCIVYSNRKSEESVVKPSLPSQTKSEESPVFQTCGNLRLPQVKTVSFQDELPQNRYEQSSYPASNIPPYREQRESVTHESHILKLIEGQNQQILYLHKVLEKVLEKLTTSSSQCNPCSPQNCQHCSCKSKDIQHQIIQKKVAIVQTSISEVKPETRTVATNTDVSWANIASAFNKTNKRTGTLTHKEHGGAKSPVVDKQTIPQPSTEGNRSSFQGSAKKEPLLTLVDINMDTAYDPPSPEPSLHLDVPEYQDQSHIEESIIDHQYGELEGEEYPLAGESALMYRERRLKEEKALRKDKLAKDSQREPIPEPYVGTTFYNNALNNVQQILGETRREKSSEESPPIEEERHKEFALNATQKKGLSMPPVHPQQFGISFLDPATMEEKPRGGPAFDTFFLPALLQRINPNEDLEVLDGVRRQRRYPIPNHISDDRLVAIARQSSVSRPNPKMHLGLRQTEEILYSQKERRENDFSFATKQFLGRYELDN